MKKDNAKVKQMALKGEKKIESSRAHAACSNGATSSSTTGILSRVDL